MARRYHNSRKTASPVSALCAALLPRLIESYLMECDLKRHSGETLSTRRGFLTRFDWWLRSVARAESVGADEVRGFLLYVTNGHKEPGGRWENARQTRPTKPGTVKTYDAALRAFFNWLVDQEEMADSPMARIPRPVDRPDQVQPFTDEQLTGLRDAAKRTTVGVRDNALFCVMLDTGIRESELCGLTVADCDLQSRQLWVREGKGGKARMIPFSVEAKRAILAYLNLRGRDVDAAEPLFATESGPRAGEPMRRFALLRAVYRWAETAGIQRARCSPHTFRHTFAVKYLKNGGDVFSLQVILGHTSLDMTSRYVALAKADVVRQHAQFSPLESMKKGNGRR